MVSIRQFAQVGVEAVKAYANEIADIELHLPTNLKTTFQRVKAAYTPRKPEGVASIDRKLAITSVAAVGIAVAALLAGISGGPIITDLTTIAAVASFATAVAAAAVIVFRKTEESEEEAADLNPATTVENAAYEEALENEAINPLYE